MLSEQTAAMIPRTRTNYRWSTLKDETLRQLFVAGDSGESMAAAINDTFGTEYSPNAVLCRAHVIGLRRPGKRPAVEWTDAMNATLRDSIETRKTYTQISAAMGISISTIGNQARRLDLPICNGGDRRTPEEQAASRERIERRDDARKREKRLNRLLYFVPREWRESVPLPVSAPAVTDPLNLSLMEVGQMQCHWITNDDMTAPLYCGHPVARGSWCAKHREIAINLPATDLVKVRATEKGRERDDAYALRLTASLRRLPRRPTEGSRGSDAYTGLTEWGRT